MGEGSSLNDMSDVGPIRAGGRKRMRVESEGWRRRKSREREVLGR